MALHISPPTSIGGGPPIGAATPALATASLRRGFTLVELMVVVAILAVLLGSVIAITSTVMSNAKAKHTKAIMLNIQLAIDQFETDAPLGRVADYRNRYRGYPCDELEAFVGGEGIPGDPTDQTIGPGAGSDLNVPGTGLDGIPDRSIKAMALTIRLYSPEGAAILDRISPKYRRPPQNADEYFDRDPAGAAGLDIDDEPLIYFVDPWGTPFDYFAVNPVPGSAVEDAYAATDPGGLRYETSQFLIRKNRGKPVLMSYGPDGPEQRSGDFDGMPAAGLVEDYNATDPVANIIDHPLNEDNVYLDDTLTERLRQPE